MVVRGWIGRRRVWLVAGLALMLVVVYWNRPAVEDLPKPTDEQLTVDLSPLALEWNAREGIPWRTSTFLAQVCESSYLEGETLAATLASWKLGPCDEVKQGSMFAYIASNDDVVLLAFRGTDDPRDWLVNLSLRRISVSQGSIHGGFHSSMLKLRPDIMASLERHGVSRKKLWVTGHSLGGALAVSFAYSLIDEGQVTPWGLVTFGQPILVNTKLGHYLDTQLDGRYLRFVNGRDMVTNVVPTYATCGTRIWFHNGKVEVTYPRSFMAASDDGGAARPESAEPEAMSEEEFKRLQEDLRRELAEEELARQEGKTLYKGNSAWLIDHNMSGYLTWIVNGPTLK